MCFPSQGNNTNNTLAKVAWGPLKVGYQMHHCGILDMAIREYRVVPCCFLLCTNVISHLFGEQAILLACLSCCSGPARNWNSNPRMWFSEDWDCCDCSWFWSIFGRLQWPKPSFFQLDIEALTLTDSFMQREHGFNVTSVPEFNLGVSSSYLHCHWQAKAAWQELACTS